MQPTFPAAAIYALTPQGFVIGQRLVESFGGVLFAADSLQAAAIAAPGEAGCADAATSSAVYPQRDNVIWFDSLPILVARTFTQYKLHIFVAATGIVVRCIAPFLQSKTTDPAVLVIDQGGHFVISLLSGHLGKANVYTSSVAEALGATPVITTATDIEGLPSLDVLARQKGLIPADPADMSGFKAVSAALLAKRPVHLHDPGDWLELAGSPWFTPVNMEKPEAELQRHWEDAPRHSVHIIVTEKDPARLAPSVNLEDQGGAVLYLHPPVLYIGIGCRRGISAAAIFKAVQAAFSLSGLSLSAAAGIASIDAKMDEEGLLTVSRTLELPCHFFSKALLASLPVSAPSAKALEIFGIPGVCEPAALAAAQGLQGGRLEVVDGAAPSHAGKDTGVYGQESQHSGIHAASLLFPKMTLNGVTVAVAMRHAF